MINMDIPSAVLKERAKATLRGTYWTFVRRNAHRCNRLRSDFRHCTTSWPELSVPSHRPAVALFYTIPVSLGVQRMYIRTAQGCGVNTNEIFNIEQVPAIS